MSRVRFHQTTFTNPPRYKKRTKNRISTIQQSAANMSHSELFEWDDFLNDQIFTGRNEV
jgi:hypothetical protein